MISVFCGKCGKELPENADFCPYCGYKKINLDWNVSNTNVQSVQSKLPPRDSTKKKLLKCRIFIYFVIAYILALCFNPTNFDGPTYFATIMGAAIPNSLVYMIIFFIAKQVNVIKTYCFGECYFLAMLVGIFAGDGPHKIHILTLKSVPVLVIGFILYALITGRKKNGGDKNE